MVVEKNSLKSNRRKGLLITTLLLMVCCMGLLFPCKAYATDVVVSGICGDTLTWSLDEDGQLVISGEGDMYDYVYALEEYSPWYNHRFMIKEIIIQSGVTSIGERAFAETHASECIIPETVSRIGEYAFYSTKKLETIVLPKDAKIERSVFSNSGIKSVVISDNEDFGYSAFEGCTNLEEVSLSNDMLVIPGSMFSGCTSLKTINIPNSVKSIASSAFIYSGLETITIPSTVESIGTNAFYDCELLKTVTIFEGLKSIGEGAFHCCPNLTELNLPESITSLQGNQIFDECPKLTIKVIEDSYAEQYVKAFELNHVIICRSHKWNESYTVDKEATCTEEGRESIHCSVCNAINEETVRSIEKAAHNYGDWKVTKEATCTEDGSKEKVCSGCGDEVTEVITAPGHQWNKEYTTDKEPTCTEEGQESIHCSVCDVIDKDSVRVIDKIAHNYGDWTVTKEATCTEDGSKEKVCSGCGDKVTEVIASPGHQWNKGYTTDKEATCTEEGQESIHCSVCDVKKEERTVRATGHNFGNWVEVSSSTCENPGLQKRVCKTCGFTESEYLDPNGHEWENTYVVDVAPTCTTEGSESIHCKNCDAVKGSKTIKATGHSYGDWKVTKEAVCIASGTKEKVCIACGNKVTETIPSPGHQWNTEPTVDKPATYSEDGSQSIHCSVCGEIQEGSQQVIPMLEKLKNTMTAKAAKKMTVKYVKVKKKAITVKPITVKNPQGTVSYKLVSGNAKSKKALKLNKKTGKVTVKRKTAKGTYKIKVKVTAAGTDEYKAASKNVNVTVVVK